MYFLSCNFKHISCHFVFTICNFFSQTVIILNLCLAISSLRLAIQTFFSEIMRNYANQAFFPLKSQFISLLSNAYFVGKITKGILSEICFCSFNFLLILSVVNEEYMFGNMLYDPDKTFCLQNRQVTKPRLAIRSIRRTLVAKQLIRPAALLIFIYFFAYLLLLDIISH